LVHVGKYRRQIENTDNTATKHNPEKQTMSYTARENYPGLVDSYDAWPGNKVTMLPSPHEALTKTTHSEHVVQQKLKH